MGQPISAENSFSINRVRIKNYKSISYCDVRLNDLQFLVGRNGAGKSNFLDALAFVKDAMAENLAHAVRIRGGIRQVRRRSGGHPQNVGIRLDFNLDETRKGWYAFELSSEGKEKFFVRREICKIIGHDSYEIKNGEAKKTPKKEAPPVEDDRLYLTRLSGVFRELYDNLSKMVFYNINSDTMKKPQESDTEPLLKSDGANIASVLDNMVPATKERIREYLAEITPFVSDFAPREIGDGAWKTMKFKIKSQRHPWHLQSLNMSDGTMRALGVLTALMQKRKDGTEPVFVGIEEPETALHASIFEVLVDAIKESSETRQVVITTHSTELLDALSAEDYNLLLPVVLDDSETRIGNMEKINSEILREHLTTAAELMRQDMLLPEKLPAGSGKNIDLFKDE